MPDVPLTVDEHQAGTMRHAWWRLLRRVGAIMGECWRRSEALSKAPCEPPGCWLRRGLASVMWINRPEVKTLVRSARERGFLPRQEQPALRVRRNALGIAR